MSELLSWLRSTIAGDKAAAEAIEDSSAPWDGQWIADGNKALRTYNQHVLAHVGGWEFKPGVLDHLARHDPRDTIARCEAELALLDQVDEAGRGLEQALADQDRMDTALFTAALGAFMLAAKSLAKGRRHRPGFNPEWVA